MLSVKLVLTLVLSQYVRSHVDKSDPTSQCVWWHDGTLITFQQSVAGNPETPGDTEFTAVTAAFATWGRQLDACSSLHLDEGPRSSSRAVQDDDTRLVLFRQVDCDEVTPACATPSDCGNERDCWEHANGALAITSTFYDVVSGQISDADIELNTRWFLFTTVDAPACVAPNFHVGCVASDVQNTLTHEIGHLLGLGHSPAPSSTMYLQASPGETSKRVLDADSKQFICDVYPAGRPARTCLLPAYDGELGKPAGCSASPGAALALLGLLLLRRGGRSTSGNLPLTCTKRYPAANCLGDYPWSASWSLGRSAGLLVEGARCPEGREARVGLGAHRQALGAEPSSPRHSASRRWVGD